MFGFSPTKLLFTVLVIAAIWYGFKWLNRNTGGDLTNRGGDKGATPSRPGDDVVEDMVRCEVCGDFMPSGRTKSCGRADCPHG